MIILFDNEIFRINIEIIINRNLCNKNVIDENTFMKVNEILLKKLNELQ